MSLSPATGATTAEMPLRPPTLQLPLLVTSNNNNSLNKPPPLICEQGPSAPASPTSPATRQRRFCPPLSSEAMSRINLLTSTYGMYGQDFGKLSPLSPNYSTSDLGSSPRSSISVHSNSGLGPWMAYREHNKSSFDLDDKDLNSPGFLLSPAPYSPFSDGDETPFSAFARSPNLSPSIHSAFHHFSFDPIRSSSSMSSRHHLLVPSASLDEQSRERSRSDSDMSPNEDKIVPHSTISVPVATSSGQYKKRLLQKYQQEAEHQKRHRSSSSPPPSTTGSEVDEAELRSVSRLASPPPQPPTLQSVLPAAAVSGWIENQMSLLNNVLMQIPRTPILLPTADQAARVLRQTTIDEGCGPLKTATLWRRSRSETDVSRQQPIAHNFANGVFACSSCGAGFSCHDRLAKHIASRHRDRSATAALDEGAKIHKCTQCPKKFTRSDMLTRHMRLHTGAKPYECLVCGQVFSRSDHLSTHQRTHTGEKPYQCSKCNYTASRRDMITRHFRTHDVREGEVAMSRLTLGSPSPVPPVAAPFPVGLLPPSSPLPIPMALLSLNPPDPHPIATIGSGEKSAFAPPNRLLAPPTLIHSLSVPSSPLLSRQNSLSPALSRQSSVGGYDQGIG